MNPKDKIIKLQGAAKPRPPVAPSISVYALLLSLLVMLLSTPVLYAQEVNVDNIVIDIGNGTYFVTDGGITIQNLGGIKNNGTVELKGNWANITSYGLIFGSTGTVIFNGISSGQFINGPNSTLFTNLTIDNSNGVTMTVPTNINGTLSFLNGKISAPTVAVEIYLGGSIIGAGPGKYIHGLLYIDANTGGIKNFPVGDATIYAPVNLNLSGFSGNGSIGVYTLPGFNPNENNPVTNASGISQSARANRYWNVSSAGISFSGADATFNFDASEATGNPLNYVVRKFNFPSTWSATTTGTVTGTSTQALGLTSFSEFEVGEAPAPTVSCFTPLAVFNTPNLCSATISLAQLMGQIIVGGSPTPTVTFSPPAGTFPVGTTPVTATVTNINGTANCSFNVVVTDNQPPTATCQNITVNLSAGGTASITASQVNNGSTDNCGAVTLSASPTSFTCSNAAICPADLFISEYIEGSSNNKAIEIYNGTGAAVNLAAGGYQLFQSSNGGSGTATINLTGTVANGDVYVVAQSTANAGILAQADQTTTVGLFNGNDAIVLQKSGGIILDIIGQVGCDPGTQWLLGGNSTLNTTLRRNSTIASGVTINPAGACGVGSFPTLSTEWTGFATDNIANLGAHTFSGCVPTPVVLTVTDASSNTATCTAQVTVRDVTAPSITCPANITIQCNTSQLPAATGAATATDACTASPVMTYTDVNSLAGCNGTGTITRTWRATDASGNFSTCVQTITVIDNTAPVIGTPAVNQTVQCDGAGNIAAVAAFLASNGGAAATDNCGAVTWTYSFGGLSDGCGATGTGTAIFYATDACNNVSSTSATFTIIDNLAPALTLPANITIQCNTSQLPAATGTATATDACSGTPPSIWINEFHYDNAGADVNEFIEIAGTAGINLAGNSILLYNGAGGAVYTTIPLSGVIPNLSNGYGALSFAAVGLQNGNPDGIALVNTSSPAVIEFISYGGTMTGVGGIANGITSTDVGVTESGAATGTSISRVGSGSSRGQFTWALTTTQTPAAANIGQTFVAAGSGIAITFTDVNSLGGCNNTGTIARTWTATDACGNASSGIQTITVIDNIAPTITTAASNSTVQCDGAGNTAQLNVWLASHGGTGAATDNCGTVTWTHNFTALSDLCGATGSATVIFTATDACNNSSTTSATFTIIDNVAPAIGTAAGNQTVQCDGAGNTAALNAWLSGHGGAAATDACSGVTWTHNFTALSDLCGATGSATVIFTATDDCNNSSTTSATFTIIDNVAPAIGTAAGNQTVQCDGAGNTAALNAWLSGHGGAAATDACSGVTWTHNFTALSDLCGATGSATVIFTATDACNNSSTTSATFTIIDNVAPAIGTAAGNQMVQCDGAGNTAALNAWLSGHGGAAATDACSGVTWTHNFTALSDLCGATGSATVIFTATDDCNNSSTTSATFTIIDNVAPTITTAASNSTVQCDGTGNTAQLNAWLAGHGGTGAATDACSGVTWTHNFTALSDLCGATGSATVIFTATDDCNNSSTTSATFTIIDNVAPTITTAASNSTVQCDGAGNTAALNAWLAGHGGTGAATDACSGVTWTHNFTALSDLCGATGSATVIFTATDDCNNSSTTSATFTIIDNIAPTAVCQNATIYLNNSGAASITAAMINNGSSDVCSGSSVTLAASKTAFDCSNLGTNTVTLTVTDDCGNSSTCTATVTVIDNIPPTISCPANMLNIPNDPGFCYAVVTYATPVGNDNCPSTTVQTTGLPSGSQFPVGVTTNTFVVTDASGNSATCSFNIIVGDVQNPTITCPPDVIFTTLPTNPGDCFVSASLVNIGNPTTGDNCAVAGVTNNAPAQFPVGATIVDWEVEDVNGNKTQCQQFVIVQDNEPPVIHNMPANITVTADPTDCYPAITWTAPTASDNCGYNAWDFTSDYQIGDEFPEGTTTVTYTLTDINGNTVTASFTVTILTQPLVVATSSPTYNCGYNISCNGLSNGSASAAVTGGCLPYSYIWNNGNAGLSTISNLTAGTYTVTVTDDNGHVTVQTITLTQPPVLSTTLGADQSFEFACTCVDLIASGAATTGGCTPYTYAWSTSATTSQINVCPGQTTTYTVTVTDNNGCTASDVINIIKPALVAQMDRYVLMGLGTLNDDFGNNTNVHTGAVGHRGITGKVVLGNNGIITEWLAANSVQMGNNNHVGTLYRNIAVIGSGNAIPTTITPVTIPITTKVPCFPIFSGGSNVSVGGTPVTLSPGTYNNVTLGNGSTLRLNPGVYQFNALSTGNNASVLPVSPANARDIMIFVKTTATFGNNCIVKSNIYSKLDMNIGNNNNGEYRGAFYSGTRFLTGNNGHFYLDTYCFSNIPYCNSREDVTGIIQQASMLNLFPNPNSGTFTIQYAGQTGNTINISVLNMLGQVLYERNVMEFFGEMEQEIDVRELPPGMYFIQLSNGDELMNKQFVITR